jgi:hypothetical protein
MLAVDQSDCQKVCLLFSLCVGLSIRRCDGLYAHVGRCLSVCRSEDHFIQIDAEQLRNGGNGFGQLVPPTLNFRIPT